MCMWAGRRFVGTIDFVRGMETKQERGLFSFIQESRRVYLGKRLLFLSCRYGNTSNVQHRR